MSYDKWYLCSTADPATWTAQTIGKRGKVAEFEAELARLEEQGHIVTLSSGANLSFDEVYAFEREADAVAFYMNGYKNREYFSNDPRDGFPERRGGFGFRDVSLYLAGILRGSKSQNPRLVIEHAYRPQEGASSKTSST